MNREQFYELLDIESAEDFQYFENLAAFFECEEELDYEDIAALFGAVDQAVLAELIDEYFEEITNFVPGSETEVFSIFENVRRALVGLCRNCEEDETLRSKLMEELERFRRWYSIDSRAYCTDPATLIEEEKTMRDALLLAHVDEEGGPLNRAPRNSVLAEMFVLQALSAILQADVAQTPAQYVHRHPGGALGKIRDNER